MDLNQAIFSEELSQLAMKFDKFYLASATQKIILSIPNPNDDLPDSEKAVIDVANFLVNGTTDSTLLA